MVIEDRFEWGAWMTRKALLRKPVHRWFAFPHSFASELVHALIDEWKLTSKDLILDPFVGAGTTVLAAKERNIAANGYDISPLAELVSRVKSTDYQCSQLKSVLETLGRKLDNRCASSRHLDESPELLIKALPGDLLGHFSGYAAAIDDLTCSATEKDFFKLALIAIIPVFSRAKGNWRMAQM